MNKFITILVLCSACAGSWSERGVTAAYVTSSALVACDAGQTIWSSDHGRWDRQLPNGNMLAEMNPVLGRSPSPDALAAVAVGNAVLGAVLLNSRLPDWLKATWFVGLAATETYMVAHNGMTRGLGVCGVVGQRTDTVTAEARMK